MLKSFIWFLIGATLMNALFMYIENKSIEFICDIVWVIILLTMLTMFNKLNKN